MKNIICGGRGIGDAVCGLYAVAALGEDVTFYTRHPEWLADVAGVNIRPYGDCVQVSREIHGNVYADDAVNMSKFPGATRKQVYLNNIGAGHLCPVVPTMNKHWEDLTGRIVVVPSAAWTNRVWNRFPETVRLLTASGYAVSVLCQGDHSAYDDIDCEVLFGRSPAEVIELIRTCRLMVGNDSGMAHLAALYGVPVLVVMDEHLGFDHVFSDTGNINVKYAEQLSDISPADVVRAVNDLDFPCFRVHEAPLIRLGSKHDGGYVIADVDDGYDLLLGCGVGCGEGDNVEFERDFVQRYECECKLFDGTMDRIPELHGLTLVEKNIDPTNSSSTTNLSREAAGKNNIFLKMDIEGAEWDWLNHTDILPRVKQMVVEFHDLIRLEQLRTLEKILFTHNLVHAHGNNFNTVRPSGIPRVLELTFLRKDIPVGGIVSVVLGDADSPNWSNAPEIPLGAPFVA